MFEYSVFEHSVFEHSVFAHSVLRVREIDALENAVFYIVVYGPYKPYMQYGMFKRTRNQLYSPLDQSYPEDVVHGQSHLEPSVIGGLHNYSVRDEIRTQHQANGDQCTILLGLASCSSHSRVEWGGGGGRRMGEGEGKGGRENGYIDRGKEVREGGKAEEKGRKGTHTKRRRCMRVSTRSKRLTGHLAISPSSSSRGCLPLRMRLQDNSSSGPNTRANARAIHTH